MTDIVIIDRHESLSLLAAEILSHSFEIRYCSDKSLYKTGKGKILNIWRTDRLNGMASEKSIIVLGETCVSVPRIMPDSTVIIANAMNKEQMSVLTNVTGNVITCGNLIMDTVSYTSVTDDTVFPYYPAGLAFQHYPAKKSSRLKNLFTAIMMKAYIPCLPSRLCVCYLMTADSDSSLLRLI